MFSFAAVYNIVVVLFVRRICLFLNQLDNVMFSPTPSPISRTVTYRKVSDPFFLRNPTWLQQFQDCGIYKFLRYNSAMMQFVYYKFYRIIFFKINFLTTNLPVSLKTIIMLPPYLRLYILYGRRLVL